MKAFFLTIIVVCTAASAALSPTVAAAEAVSEESASATASKASVQATGIVDAAEKLLNSLDTGQRAKLVFDFGDKEQRARWSNLPTGMVPRRGLRMGDLNSTQRVAVMALLSSVLSKMGYEKIVGIVEADEALKSMAGRGGPSFGRDEFYVSLLGLPSRTSPWMLQFGGHHLGLNVTFTGQADVLTPSLIAVQPARFTLNGQTVRPLGRETDKAFELVNSLDADQRKEAVLGFQMRDLVLGPGHDGELIQPEGLKASALNDRQRQMLLDLIQEWSGIIHDKAAAKKLAEVKSNLDNTWFAWSGTTEPGSAAYFRVQGPTVVIEYAPQRLGNDPTQHIHTIYRDPTNDYGKQHLAQ